MVDKRAICNKREKRILNVTALTTISGAVTSKTLRYYSNSVYEPEVSGSTGITPGFSEWAAFYQNYRVTAYEYTVTAVNNEAFPVFFCIVNTNIDPGTGGVSSSNPLSQNTLLAAKGGMDRQTFEQYLTIFDVVGEPEVKYDDTHAAAVTTNPVDLAYIGFNATASANITNGITLSIKISYHVTFYERKIQS